VLGEVALGKWYVTITMFLRRRLCAFEPDSNPHYVSFAELRTVGHRDPIVWTDLPTEFRPVARGPRATTCGSPGPMREASDIHADRPDLCAEAGT
jgi:hypothetical protein